MDQSVQPSLEDRARSVLHAAQVAAQADVSQEARKHAIDELERLVDALRVREHEIERERAWVAATLREIDVAGSRLRRAGEQPDAWMWTEDALTVVDQDGHRWVRLRSWERSPDTRAWMCVPYGYDFREEDEPFFALKAQLGVWRTVAPVLLKDKPWPSEFDQLAEDRFPDTAARLTRGATVPGRYYQVKIVSRLEIPSGRQRATKNEDPAHQPRPRTSQKDRARD